MLIRFTTRSTPIESPLGVAMTTTRLPTAEPELTAIVAVSDEPSALTLMFDTVMLVSIVPDAVMNLSAVAPVSPAPVIVTLVAVFRVKLPGEML
jgi:hypothetical protein